MQNEALNKVIDAMNHPFFIINVDDYKIEVSIQSSGINPIEQDITCYCSIHNRDKP